MSGRPAGKPDLSGYNYGAISSLVLTADRSALPRRDKEPDGAPTSLAGRIDPREMGSRVQRAVPKDLDKKRKKATDKQDSSERAAKRRQEASGFGYADSGAKDRNPRPWLCCSAEEGRGPGEPGLQSGWTPDV
jgi:pre-mRNA-splicing helicase BRR2